MINLLFACACTQLRVYTITCVHFCLCFYTLAFAQLLVYTIVCLHNCLYFYTIVYLHIFWHMGPCSISDYYCWLKEFFPMQFLSPCTKLLLLFLLLKRWLQRWVFDRKLRINVLRIFPPVICRRCKQSANYIKVADAIKWLIEQK